MSQHDITVLIVVLFYFMVFFFIPITIYEVYLWYKERQKARKRKRALKELTREEKALKNILR